MAEEFCVELEGDPSVNLPQPALHASAWYAAGNWPNGVAPLGATGVPRNRADCDGCCAEASFESFRPSGRLNAPQ